MSLLSHSFEHICLREGGKSVRSLGKAGVIRIRGEVGVGRPLDRNVHVLGIQRSGLHTTSREEAAPRPARKRPGKTSLAMG